MDKRVELYLNAAKQRKRIERDKILIQAGLYTENYDKKTFRYRKMPETEIFFGWGENNTVFGMFEKTPIEVTDEEFEIIRKNVLGLEGELSDGESLIAQKLKELQTLLLRQERDIITIKKCVLFFTTLTIISMVITFILVLK